jgi:MOSC domain-containing protein YiiM
MPARVVAVCRSADHGRQVHLIHSELHDELRAAGFDVSPEEMGENITTSDLDPAPGDVRPDDPIRVQLSPAPRRPLGFV